jgi:hypothetical protein
MKGSQAARVIRSTPYRETPRSSLACVATPICSTPPCRPLYQSNHRGRRRRRELFLEPISLLPFGVGPSVRIGGLPHGATEDDGRQHQ